MKQDACFDLRMIGADAVPTIALASELFIERNGKGTFTFASGAKYVGQFKDDKKHGEGTYTFADGTIDHQGEWEFDHPVDA